MSNNMTTQEHWELHQGLWNAIGCNMKVIEQDETTIRYVDFNSKRYKGFYNKFTYTSDDNLITVGVHYE
jgi:hypothetical protein|tara:strand:+ start:28 stop:234 length:207 start_codon:yes stop_codon:yes gene_type:complete